MAAMQARSVAAIRRHDAAFEAEYGPGAVWVAVSHGDVIKSILADALGMHLDLFPANYREAPPPYRSCTTALAGRASTRPTPTRVICRGCQTASTPAMRRWAAVQGRRRREPHVPRILTCLHVFTSLPGLIGSSSAPLAFRGARTFYLQVRAGAQIVSIALEKQQSALLAEKIDEILDQLITVDGNPFSVPTGYSH